VFFILIVSRSTIYIFNILLLEIYSHDIGVHESGVKQNRYH